MSRTGSLVVVGAVAVGVMLGCVRAASPPAPPPAPQPICAATPVKGKPALCFPKDGSDLFVVGLPEGHGWDRGDWVMLDVAVEGTAEPVPLAMAVVMERYPDLAKVSMLYQREVRSLEGARARRISKDERARLGKYVGRITQVDLARVRIDVGAQDKAVVGDVYQVLSSRDHQPIGRLQITEVGDFYAWGKRLDQREEFRDGLDAVYLKDARGGGGQPVLILVVNFDPHDPKDGEEAKAGRGFAKDLADSLAGAAKGSSGINVRYDGNERVKLGAGDEEGHKQARDIGKRFLADIVVWGSMRCDKQACAQPRFTVVDPNRLKARGYKGAEIWMEQDKAGFSFEGTAPEDPLRLGAAILGSVAYDAERYADAAYYLGQAVSKNVLRGEDELRGRWRLAYAMFVRGQAASARTQAELLVQRAREAREPRWEQFGHSVLARVDALEGRMDSARGRLLAIRSWSLAHNDQGELSHALHQLAILAAQEGRASEARELYQQSLDLARRLGDVQGESATLHELAILEAQEGRVEEARKLYQQSLELNRRIGNVEGEIATMASLAVMDYEAGKKDAARQILEGALGRARAISHVEYQAVILDRLAQIDLDRGDVGHARQRWSEAQALFEKLKMKAEAAEVAQQLTMLTALDKATEVWKAQPALLAGGGILLTRIQPGGQADKATLAVGDILLRYNTTRLDKPATLQQIAKSTDPAKTVTVELLRGAQKLTIQVHEGMLGVAMADLPPNPAAPKPDTPKP